jgi:vacuolar protein-sorting-associated protein 4
MHDHQTLAHALYCRFQRRIYIPLPDDRARAQMFEVHLSGIPHSLKNDEFLQLALLTPNYSGSDVRNVVQDARYQAARELKDATHFLKVGYSLYESR